MRCTICDQDEHRAIDPSLQEFVDEHGVCTGQPIDWRARALAAEAQRDRTLASMGVGIHCSFCGKNRTQVLKLISGPRVFICDECVGLCVDILDEALVRRWDYESIARRALVAGLAECDRLRLCGNVAPEYAGMTVVLGGSPEHEQAIRADAAREERDAIVRWLLSLQSDDYSAGGLAGRINNEAHAALRAGGGGSDATR